MAFQIRLPTTFNPMSLTMRQDDNACGQLSLAMARAAHNWAENDTELAEFVAREFDLHQLVFYHGHQSNLESIAESLTELHVLKNVVGSNCYFTFAYEMTEVAKVAVSHREEGPDFQHMLHYFCYHFSDYGADYYGLNFHIDTPFCPQRGMGDVIDALAELGYARRLGVGSVVQVENPSLSSGWADSVMIVQNPDPEGFSFSASRRPERMQFLEGMGKPCFIWTERMQAITADGMVWDELEGFGDRI